MANIVKENIQAVVFDLDYTLLNTEKTKSIFTKIAIAHGLTEEKSKEIYKLSRNDENGNIAITLSRYLDYLERELQKLGRKLEREKVENIYENFKNKNKKELLLNGAEELLNYCLDKKIPIYLLTLGVPEWQIEKIKLSGLDKYFSEEKIYFTQNEDRNAGKKEEMLSIFRQGFDGSAVILFNDRPDESEVLLESFPNLKVFLLNDLNIGRFSQKEFLKLKEKYQDRLVLGNNLHDLLKKLSNC